MVVGRHSTLHRTEVVKTFQMEIVVETAVQWQVAAVAADMASVAADMALVAALGLVVIVVCYIGVNLLGIGLHSYGWFFG